jgi:predicted transcriptional regulator
MKEKLEDGKKPEPTRSELEILQVLWEHGPSTVRFVNDQLNHQREVNYTSTLKLMQIMFEKGILVRDETSMKHVYSVAEEEQKTKAFLLDKFVDAMYKGSASKLIMQLLGDKKTSKEEMDAIRKILKNIEGEGKK